MKTKTNFLKILSVGLFLLAGCGPTENTANNSEKAQCAKNADCNKPISNLAIVKTKHGFPMVVDIRDGYIAKFLAETGVWEEGVSIALKNLIKAGDNVLELGANYGYHTIAVSQIVGEAGSVYSYEANPHVCDILQKNKALNGLNNLTIKCLAVSNKKGEVSFTVDYTNLGASFVNTRDASSEDMLKLKEFKNSETFTVQADLVDNNADLTGKAIDLLRMDIEGSEVLAIQGATNLFQNSPNLKIVMEWSIQQLEKFGNVRDMISDLKAKGFKHYYIIENDGSLTEKTYDQLFTLWDMDIVITKELL